MNEVEKTPELIFKEYEEDTVSRYSHQWADKIGRAIPLLEAQGREDEKQQAVWECALSLLHVRDSLEERKRLGGRFGPMMTTADGSQLPNPVVFTDDALDYYTRRADETSNPIHRARYRDFLWEKRYDHKFARRAMDAYLQCLLDLIRRLPEYCIHKMNESGIYRWIGFARDTSVRKPFVGVFFCNGDR